MKAKVGLRAENWIFVSFSIMHPYWGCHETYIPRSSSWHTPRHRDDAFSVVSAIVSEDNSCSMTRPLKGLRALCCCCRWTYGAVRLLRLPLVRVERLGGIWFRMTSDTCVPNLKFWLWYINPAIYVIAHVLALVNASVKGTGTAGALLDDGRTKLATN